MSHIVEFKVARLAGRKDVYAVKLNRAVNIFFGLNGSGKTSLLRILDSAMAADASRIRTVPFEWAEVTIHSVNYDREFIRSIHRHAKESERPVRKPKAVETGILTFPGEEEISLPELRFFIEGEELKWETRPLEPDTSRTRWRHIYLPTWRMYAGGEAYSSTTGARVSAPHVEREQDWDRIFGNRLEELWSRCSNQILSEVRLIQEKGLANILRGILSPKAAPKTAKQLDAERVYKRVSAFLARQGSSGILRSPQKFISRYNKEPALRSAVADINTTEQEIEKAMASRYQLEKLIRSMFSGNKTIVFKDTGIDVDTEDGQRISLASLSSGEKHALWIFIETILVEESTLLIDEPEISMHVDWQKTLIPAMHQLNPDAQLILATHSPEIMAEIDDANIFRL